jgi:hypothetical protein
MYKPRSEAEFLQFLLAGSAIEPKTKKLSETF